MSMPGFFAPLFAWFFAMMIPVVIFYFLKLKRPQLKVPSLVLWRQVLQDNRVNSPFQKFKRNLLLLLQLLLLALLVFALMQPYMRGGADRANRMIILIDSSASMAALDKAGGQSRLDAAKLQIERIIDGMLSDQQICLISFARTATQLTDFTNNERILLDALESVKVQDVPGELEDALRMTDAISRRLPLERVLLYSDGNFKTDLDFALPFQLDYLKLDPAGPNVGITSMNAKRADQERWDLFVRVQCSSGSIPTTVELLQDGEQISARDVVVEDDNPQRLVFKFSVSDVTTITAQLKPDRFDSLASDNTAFLVLEPTRSIEAFVSHKLTPHRYAMKAMDDLNIHPADGKDSSEMKTFDIVVTSEASDMELATNVLVTDGIVPGDLVELVSIEQSEDAQVVDWDRAAPLLQHADMTDIVLLDEPVTKSGVGAREFEARGYEILVHGRRGPLIVRKRQGQELAYHLLFTTDRSTLPYRLAFPIMLSNAVKQSMELAGLGERLAARTGVLPSIPLPAESEFDIISPDGSESQLKADKSGMLVGVQAPHVGVYEIKKSGETRARVGVSLLSAEESMLVGMPTLQLDEVTVSAQNQPIEMDRSFWPTVAWIALAVLVFEWWYFNRPPKHRVRAEATA